MYIDSHAHIYLPEFDEDRHELLSRAHAEGVSKVYMPNIDSTTIEDMHDVEEKYPWCRSMMGLHPCYVKEDYATQLAIVEEWLEKRDYAAVGEVGIDLYWDKTYVDEQQKAFERQIELARDHDLAIIIHSRDSLDVTIKTIADRQDGSLRGIFHCFNGTVEQGKAIVDLGFYMGIGGVVTFKNAGVDKTVAELPLSKMVLETDAPYLSPVPHRGKRNTVGYVAFVAEKLATIFDVSTAEVGRITSVNCSEIFIN